MTLLAPVVVAMGMALGTGSPGMPERHPLHVSTAAVAVDADAVYVRVRMFKDDLEGALAAAAGLDTLALAPTPAHDAMFLGYYAERFELRFDGRAGEPGITASGEDLETPQGDERVWWVELRYPAPRGVHEIGVRARLLYERFDDQRNIVRILDTTTGWRRTLYFAAPDDDWSVVEIG